MRFGYGFETDKQRKNNKQKSKDKTNQTMSFIRSFL